MEIQMSKKITLFVALLFVTMTLWGCGGSAPEPKPEPSGLDIPPWWSSVPDDPDHLWSIGEGRSSDLGMAREKASTAARTGIAKQQELKLNNMTKRFQEEIMGEDDASQLLDQFTSVTKEVVSTTLRGAKQVEIAVSQDGRMKQVYVLFNYPLGAAAEELNNKLAKKEELYTRFRASQGFEEMEKEIEKYEQSKQSNP